VLASAWGSFFDVVAVLVVLSVAAAMVAALLVRRTVRRRWRLVRSHGAVITLLALWDATAALRAGRRRPLAGDNWSSPRRVRRSLWQAVDGAADAVRTAADLGAPVAELPSLCRRLEGAAADLDRVLRLEPGGPVPPSIRGHVQDVMRAADDVRRVAIAAAGDACDPRVAELARDADDEVQLLDAGLASARAALSQLRR
jgi:hypothetical protein